MTTTMDARRGAPRWLIAGVAGLFGLFYAYAVWSAISNLVSLVQQASEAGLSLQPLGWVMLIIAIAMPLLVFVLAYLVSRRRGVGVLAVTMLVGLALVAVFWLDVQAYAVTAQLVG